MIITLDGPAGVGKSTLARRLAQHLGITYLDTGAMFRTVALHIAGACAGACTGAEAPEGQGLDALPPEGPQLAKILAGCEFSLSTSGDSALLLCNGIAVGDEIRSERAGMMAARVAPIAQVRDFLKAAQQRLGEQYSLVAEGRDMGTVVFPHAPCKLFLDATPEIRAERRLRQLEGMGQKANIVELTEQIRSRDEQDRTRAIAPLRPADDAVIIDTSHLDIDGVFAVMLQAVQDKIGGLPGGAGSSGSAGNSGSPCSAGNSGGAGSPDGACATPPQIAMRRAKRALTREEALKIVERGEYGVLSLCAEEGWPYGVPLSYVLLNGALYFHCALKGRKITLLAASPKACFTVVEGVKAAYYEDDFTTFYESAMVMGPCLQVTDEAEKYDALMALCRKYLPDSMEHADASARRSFARTGVYRITISSLSGKAKRKSL